MTTEAPSGSAEVSATRLASPAGGKPSVGDGLTVGNKPAALPAWLCVGAGPTGGPTGGRPGREPTGSGERSVPGGAGADGGPGGTPPGGAEPGAGCVVDEVLGAVMATVTDTLAAVGSWAALPVTVRLTDLTAEAVTGTVSCAWSCRCADCGSTAPRSHDEVPSEVPQPKLNVGVPLAAGLARSLTATAVAVAPVVQAFTVQPICLPRSLLACAAVTSTQRLACVALEVVPGDAAAAAGGSVGAVVDVIRLAPVVKVDGAAAVDADVDEDVDSDVDEAEPVGEDVAVGEVVVGDPLPDGVVVGVVGAAVGVVGVAVGVGVVLVGVGVGDGDVVVGVADGLGDAAGSRSGSHDCLPAGVAALVAAAAVVAAAAKLIPETAVNRTLPATRVTAAGLGCANRMKTPYRCCWLLLGTLTRLRRSLPGWPGSSRPEGEQLVLFCAAGTPEPEGRA